jgi:hypothetical protein
MSHFTTPVRQAAEPVAGRSPLPQNPLRADSPLEQQNFRATVRRGHFLRFPQTTDGGDREVRSSDLGFLRKGRA